MLFVSAGTAAAGPFLPVYWAANISGSVGLAWVMAGYAAAKIVSGYLGGRYAGRFGSGQFIRLGCYFCLAASIGYLVAPVSVGWMLLCQLLYGAGAGLVRPMAMAGIGEKCPENKMGRFFGGFETVFYFALATGPAIGGFIAERYGASALFAFVAAVNTAAIVASLFTDDSVQERRPVPCELSSAHKSMMIYIFTRTFGISAVSVFLPVFLSASFNMTADRIGLAMAVMCAISALCMPLCGYLTDRYDKLLIMTVSSLAVSLLIVVLVFSASDVLFWTLMAGVGFFSSLSKTSSIALTVGISKGNEAYVLGMYNTCINISFAVSSFIGGILLGHKWFGVESVFIIFGLAGIAGTLFTCGTFVGNGRKIRSMEA